MADGITASGLQQTFPLDDAERQGLLPDYFHLKAQMSDGPAISPGTVQSGVPELYGKGRFYDLERLTDSGVLAHAPGAITDVAHAGGRIAFTVDGWPLEPYRVLLTRLPEKPTAVTWRGAPANTTYHADRGALEILVQGQGRVVLEGVDGR